jgi:hypothetical protein
MSNSLQQVDHIKPHPAPIFIRENRKSAACLLLAPRYRRGLKSHGVAHCGGSNRRLRQPRGAERKAA